MERTRTSRLKYAPLFRDLLGSQWAVDTKGERKRLGRLGPMDDLLEIWKDAHQCQLNGPSEAQWNCTVHAPLLKIALRHAAVNEDGALEKQSEVEVRFQNVYVTQHPIPFSRLTNWP